MGFTSAGSPVADKCRHAVVNSPLREVQLQLGGLRQSNMRHPRHDARARLHRRAAQRLVEVVRLEVLQLQPGQEETWTTWEARSSAVRLAMNFCDTAMLMRCGRAKHLTHGVHMDARGEQMHVLR